MTDYSSLNENEPEQEYERLLAVAEEKGYKPGWVYYQMVEKFDEAIAKEICQFDDEYEEW